MNDATDTYQDWNAPSLDLVSAKNSSAMSLQLTPSTQDSELAVDSSQNFLVLDIFMGFNILIASNLVLFLGARSHFVKLAGKLDASSQLLAASKSQSVKPQELREHLNILKSLQKKLVIVRTIWRYHPMHLLSEIWWPRVSKGARSEIDEGIHRSRHLIREIQDYLESEPLD